MISLLLFACAAMFNAIMDVTQFHYYQSIFFPFPAYFWDGMISWKNKYIDGQYHKGRRKLVKTKWFSINYPVQFTDAFHFFKMLMIFCLAAAVVEFKIDGFAIFNNMRLNYLFAFASYGIVWNLTFSLFYKKILRS